jgi:PST family polysaccharide transporter
MNSPEQDPPQQTSLGDRIGWTGLAQVWNLLLTIGSALILARLLTPSDYAVMAVVLPVIGAAHMVQSLGLNNAIVIAKSLEQRQLDALFWLALTVALGLIVAIILAAPAIAALVGDPRVGPVLPVATLSILFVTLMAQPSALLARQLRFRDIALSEFAASTIGTGTTVLLVALTRSYWALLAGIILTPLTQGVIATIAVRWRPGGYAPPREAGPLLHFGFKVWGGNLFQYAARNADNLIVARFASPQALGIYDRSYRVLFNPLNQASAPLAKVMVPTLSRSRDDPRSYRSQYWAGVSLLLLACHPMLALALAYPATMIGLMLGPAWLEGAPLFRWFAIGGLFQIFLGTTGWLFVSQGRGGEHLRVNLVGAVVAIASYAIGIRWGIEGVAAGMVIGQVFIALPYTLWRLGQEGPVGWREQVIGLLPHVLATLLVAALVFAERAMFGAPHWPQLIPTAILAYLVYAGVLFALPASRGPVQAIVRRGLSYLPRGRFDRNAG